MPTHSLYSPSYSDDAVSLGEIISEHLYTEVRAPGQRKARSHDRPLSRADLAIRLGMPYNSLAQVLTGRQPLSDLRWSRLLRGGDREGTKPILPFTREELDEIAKRRARMASMLTSYKAERAIKVRDRWLGWIEEGDELSLTLLKAEVIEKLKHLRQPYL